MKNLIFLFALILFTNCNNTAPKPTNSKPPNIIYILADDSRYGAIGV